MLYAWGMTKRCILNPNLSIDKCKRHLFALYTESNCELIDRQHSGFYLNECLILFNWKLLKIFRIVIDCAVAQCCTDTEE